MPIGFIIAIGELADCQRFIGDYGYFARTEKAKISEKEYLFGDFSEGRYGWRISSVIKIEPIQKKDS